MLRPSQAAARRYRGRNDVTRVLRPDDAEYEHHTAHAIRDPMYDAITTRARFTPIREITTLINGLGDEVKRRLEAR